MATTDDQVIRDSGIMPVSELKGRTVWNESGDRLGVVRGVETDADGRIAALDVQRRWMIGHHDRVEAGGMRLDDRDVIVPDAAAETVTRRDAATNVAPSSPAAAPLLVRGREGARDRFGGLDLIAGSIGALVAIATTLLVGGILTAAFATKAITFDTVDTTSGLLTSKPFWVGCATLLIGFFAGGLAAGRSARYDGLINGLLVPVWTAVIAGVFALVAVIWGNEYDVIRNVDLPRFDFGNVSDMATIGALGMLIAFACMLVAGALGGSLGELWHHRVDRSMLDVIDVADRRRQGSVETSVLATGMQSNPNTREPELVTHRPTSTDLRDEAALRNTPAAPQPEPPHETDFTR